MKKVLIFSLCMSLFCVQAFAQGNEFKVRYVGGSIPSKVKADDWGNTITVTSDLILLKLKDGQEIKINPKDIKLLTHSRHASRRIGAYAAAAIISPVFLLGMLKKNKQHFIALGVETPDGKKDGINLQAKNDKYKALLTALEGVTGMKAEEEVEEKNKPKK